MKALDNLLEGCMLIGFDWTYLYVNEAAARHGLQERDKLIGRSMLEMYPGVEQSDVFRHYRAAMEDRIPQHFETCFTFADGTAYWYELAVEPVPEGIFILSLDITIRKKSEEALDSAREFSDNLIDCLQDGFSVVVKDGRCVNANPALCRMTGFSREELVDTYPPFVYWPPEEYENIQAAFEQTLNDQAHQFELTFMRKNGERFQAVVNPSAVRDRNGNIVSYIATVKDVSHERQTLEALQQSEMWLRSIYENTNTGIAWTDHTGKVTGFNEAYRNMLGYDAQTLGELNFADFTHPEDIETEKVYFAEMLARQRNSYQLTKRYIHRDGHIIWVDISVGVIRDDSGDLSYSVAVIQDITDRKAAESEIAQLAFYDALTQLPNRRLLQDRLKQALASSARSGLSGGLLFIDLDNFKSLNDTLGHDHGDLLLKEVAQRLTSCIREDDTVARLGGDEFVVMLNELDEHPMKAARQTEKIGEKILDRIGQPYQLASYEYEGTASIGATLFSGHESTAEELMKQADIAMYQAKQAGRDTLRFFDARMQENVAARVELEGELRKAIANRQFELFYQIQVDDAYRPIGAEALLRWRHPSRGLVAPEQFIALAEETGLILPIGQWVLEAACARLKDWENSPQTRDLVLAVNVSARQFRKEDFAAQIEALVEHHAIAPSRLKLELTEGMLLEDVEDTIQTMNALTAIGVRFSLDDFGTGFSSLQYLKRLPLHQLKIDKSFVHDIDADRSDKAIVQTIIAMAQTMGLEVIAEGVETQEQRTVLLDSGCTHFQGYLFGKPLPLEPFQATLDRPRPGA